ncbi:MAG: MMPL family transporter [Aureliella sp.]
MILAWYKLHVSRFVARRWYVVIAVWVIAAVCLKTLAPSWQEIAADGDLQFLPKTADNSVGLAELDVAFPGAQSRSQMVLAFANESEKLTNGNVAVAMDAARRLHWYAASSAWEELSQDFERPQQLGTGGEPKTEIQQNVPVDASTTPDASKGNDAQNGQEAQAGKKALGASETTEQESANDQRVTVLSTIVRENIDEAIKIEDELSRFLGSEHPDHTFRRMPNLYLLRGQLLNWLRQEPEQAALDLDTPALLREQAKQGIAVLLDEPLPLWSVHIRDVWTWRNSVVGHKLSVPSGKARLISMQLDTDFTATGNIAVIEGLEAMTRSLKNEYADIATDSLQIEVAGSAAIGADMLRAAANGVRTTEIVTIVLVLVILAGVYRAPFLVAIPILSIALSLVVATSVIALLARTPGDPSSWGLGVFTTTRIFIVVILFGAGTDFCLFLLARSRELLPTHGGQNRVAMQRMVTKSWLSVHDAVVTSALTTMIGLGMMYFSEFQKFQFSGPIIAISLGITLLVCLTFTPAVCVGLGRMAFWPLRRSASEKKSLSEPRGHYYRELPDGFWRKLASAVVSRPKMALLFGCALLIVPALWGVLHYTSVTYDLTQELPMEAPSRRGQALVGNYFPTRDASPITVLATCEEPFADEAIMQDACSELAAALYIDGVESVRHLADPLGDYPPGKKQGLFDKDAWRLRLLRGHRITHEKYVSRSSGLQRRVARFDVVITPDPFSIEAAEVLSSVQLALEKEVKRAGSPWLQAGVSVSGTTVGINDLRRVTQSDQRRIQVLVALGVWFILVLLLRRVTLATFLILTVLLSYFSTLGLTHAVFESVYGEHYTGLDWKVPIFLFVILVAVGQDYNVYLVTRIFEEQRRFAGREGIRRALCLTGGIITSCGLVMAGTFVAMTSPAVSAWIVGTLPQSWLPDSWTSQPALVLRGITELGFALASGVMLDTLIVRSILVPAFVALWQRPSSLNT